jgi:hypothetical protein
MSLTMTECPTLPESLASKLVEENGHWIWQGWANDAGYPYTHFEGRDQPAYRVIWKLLVGTIPAGLELDHLCVTPMCCNPRHLEPVTHAENQRRIRERMKGCRKAGHDWGNPINIQVRPDGSRYCAQCYRKGDGGQEKKISDDNVRAIRARVAAGAKQASMAHEFGVCSGLISRIVNNKSRRNVK